MNIKEMSFDEFFDYINDSIEFIRLYNPVSLRNNAKEKFEEFEEKTKELKEVKEDLNFNDFYNHFKIYETDNYYILKIIEKHFNLGSPRVESKYSNDKEILALVEPKEWKSKIKSVEHWEDGKYKFKIFPIDHNKIKYLLNLKPEEEVHQLKDFEYRDFGWQYDREEYDDMFYKLL